MHRTDLSHNRCLIIQVYPSPFRIPDKLECSPEGNKDNDLEQQVEVS
jgi:hypothetical protein